MEVALAGVQQKQSAGESAKGTDFFSRLEYNWVVAAKSWCRDSINSGPWPEWNKPSLNT